MNKRNDYRFPFMDISHIRIPAQNRECGECLVLDVSGGGAQIATKYPIASPGVVIELPIMIGGTVFLLRGEIVREYISEEMRLHRYGIRWVELKDQDRDRLIQKLFERDRVLRSRLR
ncbi:MAG: PilZ domain-containing protein [Alicyclobacillus sp.]|nr:PilZ domain-containing protein [Alicyclobacillus sp.]